MSGDRLSELLSNPLFLARQRKVDAQASNDETNDEKCSSSEKAPKARTPNDHRAGPLRRAASMWEVDHNRSSATNCTLPRRILRISQATDDGRPMTTPERRRCGPPVAPKPTQNLRTGLKRLSLVEAVPSFPHADPEPLNTSLERNSEQSDDWSSRSPIQIPDVLGDGYSRRQRSAVGNLDDKLSSSDADFLQPRLHPLPDPFTRTKPISCPEPAKAEARSINVDSVEAYSKSPISSSQATKTDAVSNEDDGLRRSGLSADLDRKSDTSKKDLNDLYKELLGDRRHTQMAVDERITTRSEPVANNVFSTICYWSWKDDKGEWQLYDCQVAEMIEDQYRLDRTSKFEFEIECYRYVIDFVTKLQQNQGTGKTRQIRRVGAPPMPARNATQPTPVNDVGVAQGSVEPPSFLPATWESDPRDNYCGYRLVDVLNEGDSTQEYAEVVGLFEKTMPRGSLKSIKRIENRNLYASFHLHRTQMETERHKTVDVRRLFHGTNAEFIDVICRRGFDWRVAGSTSGAVYGMGSYFARDAFLSELYADRRKMFLVQVIVGDYALGSSGLVRPPPKDPKKPNEDSYDSCVDNVQDPTIFVTFDRLQTYPEYLIEF